MKLSRILESEDVKRNMVIRDQNHNEIRVSGVNEALTLPAELMDRMVVCYECSNDKIYPIRITLAESIKGIERYQSERDGLKKNEKQR